MRHKLLLAVPLTTMLLLTTGTGFADEVTLNTAPLIGDTAGPFSLVFQLTDGNGIGDGNNTVTLSNFQFGSGGPSGSPTTFGGVSGDVGSTVTLIDSTFLNYLIQPFTPGTTLEFTVITTNNVDSGGIPDGFAFSISDKTGQSIPTEAGPFADMFLTIAFDSAQPTVQTFAGDPTRLPAGGGGPISIGAPTVVSTVPEPSSVLTLLSGAALLWMLILRRSAPHGSI